MMGKSLCPGSKFYALCLSLILWLTGPLSLCQTFPFKEYTNDDGLARAEFSLMRQDSRGYIWRVVRNGVVQFDGHSFTTYLRRDGLPSNQVTKIIEDSDGIIWAITPYGPARFNGKDFRHYPVPDTFEVIKSRFGCLTDGPGKFFLTSDIRINEPVILLFDNGLYSDFTAQNPALLGFRPAEMEYSAYDSALYLTDQKGTLYKYHRKKLTFLHQGPVEKIVVRDHPLIFLRNNKVLSYDGEVMNNYSNADTASLPVFLEKYYNNPAALFNILLGEEKTTKWDKDNVIQHIVDSQGVLWLSTESWLYRLTSDAFFEYDKTSGLPDNPWAIVADPAGGFWVGSVNGELRYFDGDKFTSNVDYPGFMSDKPAFYRGSTALSNGEVWISTSKGVIIRKNGSFRRLDLIPDNIQVCTIYEDPADNSVFIGANTGLFHLTGDKVMFHPEMTWTALGVSEGIVRDANGNYWIASQSGMVFYDGEKFTPLHGAEDPADMCWGVISDTRGNIWCVSSDGLFICNPDDPGFIPALPDEINLPANVIRDLGDGRLLVGRISDLCLIDLELYYSGDPDYFTLIGKSRGFRGVDCQDNGIIKDYSGKWWVLTSDKLIRVDPERLKRNEHPPVTHITRVEYLNDSLMWVSMIDSALFYGAGNKISLNSKKNSLRISFTGISSHNPEEVTYQYRLAGLDDNWSSRTTQRQVTFNDIPPGNYIFELNAFNGDGVTGAQPETLGITIVPTFFQTTGFRISISLIAIVLTIMFAFQVRSSVLKKRLLTARQQAENYRLQLSSIIRQFDPHFTFNAVSSVGSLIMKGEKEKAYDYFIKLSGLLRSVLTDSSSLLKPLSDEIEFVKRYCELQKLRFGNRFEYRIITSESADLQATVPKMIIQSFAENALKHGLENKNGKGSLLIEINDLSGGIEVIIRDNGIGRRAASELRTGGSGLGIKNLTSIIETMNRVNNEKITIDLTDLYENNLPGGTIVRVFLPRNYSFDIPFFDASILPKKEQS